MVSNGNNGDRPGQRFPLSREQFALRCDIGVDFLFKAGGEGLLGLE